MLPAEGLKWERCSPNIPHVQSSGGSLSHLPLLDIATALVLTPSLPFLFSHWVLGTEPRALHKLGQSSTTKPHPSSGLLSWGLDLFHLLSSPRGGLGPRWISQMEQVVVSPECSLDDRDSSSYSLWQKTRVGHSRGPLGT